MTALNHATDIIARVYITTAGQFIDSLNTSHENNTARLMHAMDDSLQTKYIDYGFKDGSNTTVGDAVTAAGFLVIPSISNVSIACGLLFATADDQPDLDPITVTLEGSNVSTVEALYKHTNWILLYNGSTGIDAAKDPGRLSYALQQNFSNTIHFASYRLLITSRRNNSDAVQYAEARIMGYI